MPCLLKTPCGVFLMVTFPNIISSLDFTDMYFPIFLEGFSLSSNEVGNVCAVYKNKIQMYIWCARFLSVSVKLGSTFVAGVIVATTLLLCQPLVLTS